MAETQAERHLPAENKPRTVTVDGVSVPLDPALFDDLDMLESLYAIQHAADGGDALEIVPFLKSVCGTAYPAVKEALRDPRTGRIPMEKVGGFLQKLMEEFSPNS